MLMLAAQVAFVLMQVIVKLAREQGLDTSEVMFFRTAPALPLLWWILKRQGFGLPSTQPANVVTRSLLGSFAMATNFTAMLWLSLAQFSTLGLSQPVFVAVFAPLLLGERVAPRTWIAIALACAGAFVIVAPGLSDRSLPTLAALLAIASALSSAFAHIWVRKATAHDPPERVVFHFAAWVAVLAHDDRHVLHARARHVRVRHDRTDPDDARARLRRGVVGGDGQLHERAVWLACRSIFLGTRARIFCRTRRAVDGGGGHRDHA
jgi:drug/metabolite transporter (DMT)-like permease